jgi:hypothetical protein
MTLGDFFGGSDVGSPTLQNDVVQRQAVTPDERVDVRKKHLGIDTFFWAKIFFGQNSFWGQKFLGLNFFSG